MSLEPIFNDYIDPNELKKLEIANTDIDTQVRGGNQSIPLVYGLRRVDGLTMFVSNDVRDITNTNKLLVVYALAIGRCKGIKTIYIDNVPVSFAGNGLPPVHAEVKGSTGTFANSFFEFFEGTSNQKESSLVATYANTIKSYQDICYLAVLFYNTGQFKTVPKLSVDLFGRYCATYKSTGDSTLYANSPGYVISDLLRDPIYGKGASLSQIDETTFTAIDAACNTTRTNTSPSQKIWECNAILDPRNGLQSNLQSILETYLISLTSVNGKYFVSIEQDPALGATTIDENVIISDVTVSYPGIKYRYNRVYVTYSEPLYNYNNFTVTYPAVNDNTLKVTDQNVPYILNVSAPSLTSSRQATDLAAMLLLRSRSQVLYSFTASRSMLQFRVGDKITLNTSVPYINNQTVYITNMVINQDLTVNVECVTWSTSFYPNTFSFSVDPPTPSRQLIPGIINPTTPPGSTEVPTPTPVTPSYQLSIPSKMNEGETKSFTVNSTGIANGTVIKFDILPPIGVDQLSSTDWTTATSGSMTINSNTASVSIGASADGTTEGDETYTFRIKDSATGVELANSTFTVVDTSLTPPPPATWITIAGMPTLEGTTQASSWYIGRIGRSGISYTYNTADHTSAGFRNRVVNDGINYAYLEIDLRLVDRAVATRNTDRDIRFIVQDTSQSLPMIHFKRPGESYGVWTFNPNNPGSPPYLANNIIKPTLGQTLVVYDLFGTKITQNNYLSGVTGLYSNPGPWRLPLRTSVASTYIDNNITFDYGSFWFVSNPFNVRTYRFHFFEFTNFGATINYIGYKDFTFNITATGAATFPVNNLAASRIAYNAGNPGLTALF